MKIGSRFIQGNVKRCGLARAYGRASKRDLRFSMLSTAGDDGEVSCFGEILSGPDHGVQAHNRDGPEQHGIVFPPVSHPLFHFLTGT